MTTINEVVAIIEKAIEPKLKRIYDNHISYHNELRDKYIQSVYDVEADSARMDIHKQRIAENLKNKIRVYSVCIERNTGDYTISDIDEVRMQAIDAINKHFLYEVEREFFAKLGCKFTKESRNADDKIKFNHSYLLPRFSDMESFSTFAENIATDAVNHSKFKLNCCVVKYLTPYVNQIESASLSYVSDSPKGLEIVLHIKLTDNTILIFKTSCIDAGGYAVQQYHFRYLCHIKKL